MPQAILLRDNNQRVEKRYQITKMVDVFIRLANEADFPAILEMSQGIYGGNDYLPGVFFNYLNDPSRRILVAEKDGKAVGLQCLHIVDEGETVIAQALRVHLHYRRQGIGRKLINERRNYVKQNFPQVKFERYSVQSQSVERLGLSKKTNDTLFHTLVFPACVVTVSPELSSRLACYSAGQATNMKQLNKDEFVSILNQGNIGNILVKNKYILLAMPLKPLVSNIPCGLFKDGDSIFASYSGKFVKSLSHSRWIPAQKCPQLHITCYTQDKELLKASFIKQIENAILQHPGETFLFLPLVNVSLADYACQLLFNDLSLNKLEDEFGEKEYYHMHIYEKSLM